MSYSMPVFFEDLKTFRQASASLVARPLALTREEGVVSSRHAFCKYEDSALGATNPVLLREARAGHELVSPPWGASTARRTVPEPQRPQLLRARAVGSRVHGGGDHKWVLSCVSARSGGKDLVYCHVPEGLVEKKLHTVARANEA